MRTVAALHLSEPSGPSRTLAPVLRDLAAAGEVLVAVPGPGGAADELRSIGRIAMTGHEALVLPTGPAAAATLPARLRRDVRRFRALLRRERAELAIIATRTLPALVLAARLEGVPSVVYLTELYEQGLPGDAARAVAWRRLVALQARMAGCIVTPTRLVADGLAPSVPVVVAAPSIDPAPGDGDAASLRSRHGIPDTHPVLATIGTVSRGRGQDVALRALAMLRADRPGARLIVAGPVLERDADIAFAKELRDLAEALGVGDAVHLCGFERPADVLAAADVFVNPARFAETFGRAPMEALVAGTPVVATAVGAVPEVLGDERDALLVPRGSPEAIAAAVGRLLDEPGLAERLVRAGRARVLSAYTAERQVAGFREAVELARARAGRVQRPTAT